jgi:hypothetical protein
MLFKRRQRRQLNQARQKAAATGGVVCAYVDAKGRPHYFVAPPDADEAEVAALAFQVREGRPMSQLERQLWELAHEWKRKGLLNDAGT